MAPANPALARSEAEERFLALVRRAGLPEPEVNVALHGYELDLLWRDEGLAVEIDGYAFHGDRDAFEADRRRDAVLAAHGLQVFRITWRQITEEPEATLVLVTQALAERRPGQAKPARAPPAQRSRGRGPSPLAPGPAG